jgi:tRNA(Ile)-lysidine synthetase-like protein
VVRPLLHERRERLQKWLRAGGLGWRDDVTNRDPSIPRSGLRLALEAMPAAQREELVECSGSLARHAARLYPSLLAAARWWGGTRSTEASRRLGGGLGPEGSGGLWPGEFLLERPPKELHFDLLGQALLDAALEAVGADPRDATRRLRDDLLRDLRGEEEGGRKGRVTQLGPDLWCEAVECGLLLVRGPGPNWESGHPWRETVIGTSARERERFDLPRGAKLTLSRPGREDLEEILSGKRVEGAGTVWTVVDARAAGELAVRYPRGGDTIRPFGMRGSRRLSDLFGEAGVPRLRRGRLPVVEGRGGILWVAGLRSSELCRIDEGSEQGIRLELAE